MGFTKLSNKYIKIQLINPPVSKGFSQPTRAACFPPLDLLSLATYLQENNKFCEIEVLDGSVLSLEEILRRLNAEIVGISPKVFSYENALIIAQRAAEKGAKVFLGGVWASAIAKNILKNRSFIDGVVRGDGEDALLALSKNKKYSDVPGLVYRKGHNIIFNKLKTVDLNYLPIIDYNIININTYFENYRKKFSEHPFRRPMSIYSQKGCSWYDKSGGCIFCCNRFTYNRRKSPLRFWCEIQYMIKNYDTDLIWDVSDTFTEPKKWVEAIIASKPSNIDCSFYVYGRASNIDETMVSLLKSLGCFEILIGVESGNDKILQEANKGIKRKMIINAVKLCSYYEIKVFPTFVFGLPGEDENSIEDTLSLAEELMKFGNIEEITSSILLPLPGSRIFDMLCKRLNYPPWLVEDDLLDLAKIQNIYIELFTKVKIEDLLIANKELSSLVKENKRSSFGLIEYRDNKF